MLHKKSFDCLSCYSSQKKIYEIGSRYRGYGPDPVNAKVVEPAYLPSPASLAFSEHDVVDCEFRVMPEGKKTRF